VYGSVVNFYHELTLGLGKIALFPGKMTWFAAVPEMLRKYYVKGDNISLSLFFKLNQKKFISFHSGI
jgi:hypothetical protein